jgi:hypothetical protein
MTGERASSAALVDAPHDADAEARSERPHLSAWQCGLPDDGGEGHCEAEPELIVELL